MKYDLIIVGAGLAAKTFLLRLSILIRSGEYAQIPKVLVISEQRSYPTCSLNSTATVSKLGLQKGVGALGDQLLEAFEAFEEMLPEIRKDCFEKAVHYQILSGEAHDFERRYGKTEALSKNLSHLRAAKSENYLVCPDRLLKFMSEKAKEVLDYDELETSVRAVKENGEVITLGGKFEGERVLIAAGAAGEDLISDSFREIKEGKLASGTFLSWSCENPLRELGPSWQLGIGKFNVIYRALDQILLLGGTNSGEISHTHLAHMKEQYDKANLILRGSLPAFGAAKFNVGERSKLSGRKTFWGPLPGHENIYAIRGLYKNGYSLSFLAAKNLLDQNDIFIKRS